MLTATAWLLNQTPMYNKKHPPIFADWRMQKKTKNVFL